MVALGANDHLVPFAFERFTQQSLALAIEMGSVVKIYAVIKSCSQEINGLRLRRHILLAADPNAIGPAYLHGAKREFRNVNTNSAQRLFLHKFPFVLITKAHAIAIIPRNQVLQRLSGTFLLMSDRSGCVGPDKPAINSGAADRWCWVRCDG